jgi:hypothetical protein
MSGDNNENQGILSIINSYGRFLKNAAALISVFTRQKIFHQNSRNWANDKLVTGYWKTRWEPRNAKVAAMIPQNSKVLEFGAGSLTLPRYLPSGCTHIPSDIKKRKPGFLVCDLNSPNLPDLPKVDVVVFSGVLEYIHDLRRVVSYIEPVCHTVVCSYSMIIKNGNLLEILHRRSDGFVNDFVEDEFISFFTQQKFSLVEKSYFDNQVLCKFKADRKN